MDSHLSERVISAIEPHLLARWSSVEFALAYLTGFAVGRTRFALKNAQQSSTDSDQIRKVIMHLLDAIDRSAGRSLDFVTAAVFANEPLPRRSAIEPMKSFNTGKF